MSEYIHKHHNESVLIYHLVCPTKYRKTVFDERVDEEIKRICLETSERFEISFLEIGTNKDPVHFLIQSIPMYSATKIAQTVKGITAKEIFKRIPAVKKQLWGGDFWSKGYFINTVGHKGNETSVSDYVRKQGRKNEYKQIHRENQLSLFDDL